MLERSTRGVNLSGAGSRNGVGFPAARKGSTVGGAAARRADGPLRGPHVAPTRRSEWRKSMTRIAAVARDALAPQDQAIWDRIATGRNGRVGGPYTALLHVPALADRVAALGDYFRGEASLPAADIELTILATVREAGARYAWARHEVRARAEGAR